MADDSTAPRPWLAALSIGCVAQFLFLINLATPSRLVFDETHYVKAARDLLTLYAPANPEHPMLGKIFIAAGMGIFGDTSFGWRFFSTLAGTAVVMGVFSIGWQLTGRLRPSLFAALFAILNFTVFIQARIAMLDGYMAAFLVTGIAALLWAATAAPGKVTARLVLASILLGLAVGAKWAAIPYLVLALVTIAYLRWRDIRPGGEAVFAGLSLLRVVLIFGAVSVLSYFLTFTPGFFFKYIPVTFAELLPLQWKMFVQQTQPFPAHPYQSSWWSWPLDIRPVWYLYELVDGATRGILMIGNPAIMWGGLIAVAYCLYRGVRERAPVLLVAGLLWVGAYLPWIIIPKKIGFFYYYYVPSIFLCLALAAALDDLARRRWRHADIAFAVLAFALFGYFYPIISAAALDDPQDFRRWMWLSTWP